MKVVDPDGDVWRVRVRIIPPLPPLPRFKERARKIGSLGPPAGIAEAHYRLELRGSVAGNLLFLWPLVLLGQLLVNLGIIIASLARRSVLKEPWFVIASKRGREASRTLRWAVWGHGEARRVADKVAAALERGKGLYEIDGATLLDEPLYKRQAKG